MSGASNKWRVSWEFYAFINGNKTPRYRSRFFSMIRKPDAEELVAKLRLDTRFFNIKLKKVRVER